MIHIREIDHLVLRSKHVQEMINFYVDVLGCRVERSLPAFGLTQLRAGKCLLDLVDVDGELGRRGGAAPAAAGNNLEHFCLRIEPFIGEEIKAYLLSHSVEPGDIESRYGAEGMGPSMYICDPDGNTIELKGPPDLSISPSR
ncbi:MAG: VOC family protein [Proteobacteria bacterium]|nr:VOC family protein [Pseudomonadota bacterium]